ncbi:MAG: DUF6512 family protein [Eubacteriales bacterium]
MNKKTKLAIFHFAAIAPAMFLVMKAHYVYDNYPQLITSLFFPVNESIWEHTKLFVLPVMAVFLLVYALYGRKFKNYIPSTFLSLIYMPLISCISFGIYLMIAKEHHPSSGIIFSCAVLAIGFIVSYIMSIKEKLISRKSSMSIISMVVVFIAIMAFFTYYPPRADWLKWLFMDGENMSYGILKFICQIFY